MSPQHACHAAKTADSPPAIPPEVRQFGILPGRSGAVLGLKR